MSKTKDRHRLMSDVDERNLVLPLLLVGVLLAVLPMMLFREFTPSNELRYLSIVDESLREGHWWAFYNHGVPYADKPPFYFWCMMLGKSLTGGHYMWFYCLFSIIPAFVIAFVMDKWLARELNSSYRTAAILMLFSCGLFAGMVFTLRMDMLMTMFIVLSLYQFRKLELSESTPSIKSRLIFGFWIFMAVFSKGPMGILIPFVATTVWLLMTKRLRLWTRAWGWPTWTLLLLLCASWFGMVYAEGGTEYLDNLLFHQTMGRAVNSFHHKRPFWYYLISLTYTLLPWTFLIFGVAVYSIKRWNRGLSETGRYFLTIILSTFLLLSIISSKLQVYMLPAYPFMVYLAILVCSHHSKSRLVAVGIAVPMGLLAIAGLAAIACWLTADGLGHWWLLAGAIVLIAGTTATYLSLTEGASRGIIALGSTVLALVAIGGFALKDFKADMGYEDLAVAASEEKASRPDATLMTWKIDRPENMDVYFGQDSFQIHDSDTEDEKIEIRDFPAVVMTTSDGRKDVPYVVKEKKVGRRYVVLLCDTNTNVR